jgi:hypothetical protein
MCNVYAMYSFEPPKTATGKQKTGAAPIRSCWDNEFSHLTKYIDIFPRDIYSDRE